MEKDPLEKIKQLRTSLRQKIEEHNREINISSAEVEKIKTAFNTSRDLKDIHRLGIIKDKTMFHKACVLVLEDILKEIDRE